MRILLGFLIFAGLALGQFAQRVRFVTTDPTGACGPSYITQNTTTGVLTGCFGGTWGAIGGGGGGGVTSVYGSTGVITTLANPVFTGTATIGTTVVLDGTTNGLTVGSKVGGVLLSALSGYGFWAAGVPSSISPTFTTLTDGATVTWALGSAILANASLTFTVHSGSRTLNITNPVNGGSYVAKLIQDGTGGEGLILGTGCTWKVSGSGAGAVTLSIGANAIDILAFTYDGTNCYANFNANFN